MARFFDFASAVKSEYTEGSVNALQQSWERQMFWVMLELFLGRLDVEGAPDLAAPGVAERMKASFEYVDVKLCGGAAARASVMPPKLKEAIRHAIARQVGYLQTRVRCEAAGLTVSELLTNNEFYRACIGALFGSGGPARARADAKGETAAEALDRADVVLTDYRTYQ